MYKKIPGTRDILPEEAYIWQEMEVTSRKIFSLYNYREIRTPLVEEECLFNRSLGESAEIVQKQMFLIKHGRDEYALRPEGTASVVRAYIENNLAKQGEFSKFYYLGPMFRLERPQKGRLRQFHHIGAEAIGSVDPGLDVEVLSLADQLLKSLAISGYKIKINSLGCVKDKATLALELKKFLGKQVEKLCADCKERLKKNVLRVLDCKQEACKEIVSKLELGNKHLCPECLEHFRIVRSGLDGLGLDYTLVPQLVRGLDYYTRTVFEISHPDLGAQDALGAGGRYDNLVKELGGPEMGAIGFALGVERLLLVHSVHQSTVNSKKLVYLITLGEQARIHGLKILAELRINKIACDTDYQGRSLKGALRQANDLAARFALIIGENELNKHVVTLKDMITGEQKEVEQEKCIEHILAAS
ncbi:MAG: histidine--tRNA ligase [Candidatus Omnitrophota bacterium]